MSRIIDQVVCVCAFLTNFMPALVPPENVQDGEVDNYFQDLTMMQYLKMKILQYLYAHNTQKLHVEQITNRHPKNMHRADNLRSTTVIVKSSEFGE